MRIPRVILSREQEASVSKPEGRPPLAVGSRGGRDVTFIRKVIAYHFVDPATAAPCGFAPYSLRKTSAPRT